MPGYKKVPVVEVITSDGESVFIKDSAVIISVLEDCLKSNQATNLQEGLSDQLPWFVEI